MLVPLLAGSGIRIKIIEGMAEGVPVISTRIGAEGIPATHHQEMYFADSAADFAGAMLLLANNAELCQQIGKNAAILAEQKFLNKNLAHRLIAFYRAAWQIS
jgi:glycosyltransferase involved in cell wall biosynthesis